MKVLIVLSTCMFILCIPVFQGLDADTIQSELETCSKLIHEGRFEEAREKIQTLRHSDPDNPRAIFFLAQLEEDFDKALALFKEVEILAILPGSSHPDSNLAAEAVFARAEMEFSRGNLSAAGDLYKQIITVYSGSNLCCDALYRLGMISLSTGNVQDALKTFHLCLECDLVGKLRACAATGIMECYVELRDWPGVLESARKVLDEEDQERAVTPRVLEVIAQAWHELGNEDNAAWYTERLLKNYPDSYQAHILREKGDQIVSELGSSFERYQTGTDHLNTDAPGSFAQENEPGLTEQDAVSQESLQEGTLQFSVQASAFERRENALKMYNHLKDAGLDVRIEMKTVGGRHYYKVLVGHFQTREEAELIVDRVTKVAGEKAFVVMKE